MWLALRVAVLDVALGRWGQFQMEAGRHIARWPLCIMHVLVGDFFSELEQYSTKGVTYRQYLGWIIIIVKNLSSRI
jgi:hypothetical protein